MTCIFTPIVDKVRCLWFHLTFQIAYFCLSMVFNDIYLKPYNMLQLLFSIISIQLDLLCNYLLNCSGIPYISLFATVDFSFDQDPLVFFSALQLVVNCFYLPEHVFLSCSFLKDIFTGKSIGWHNWILALRFCLASIVSSKKSVFPSIFLLLWRKIEFYSLDAFNVLFLYLVLKSVSMIFPCVHLKIFILPVYPASIYFFKNSR